MSDVIGATKGQECCVSRKTAATIGSVLIVCVDVRTIQTANPILSVLVSRTVTKRRWSHSHEPETSNKPFLLGG